MGKKPDFLIAVILLIVMTPLFFFMLKNSGWTAEEFTKDNGKEQQTEGSNSNSDKETESNDTDEAEKDKEQEGNKIIWGVDSASPATKDLYICVNEQYGKPEVWARYLGSKEGVSQGMTKKEIQYLQEQKVKILPIYNHFTRAQGYDNGVNMAKEAVRLAENIDLPKEKAIFADIEPDYPVDSDFIRGWFDGIKESSYQPGVYGVFSKEQSLYKEYVQASEDQEEIKKQMIVWSAYPQVKITSKKQAPDYKPAGPPESLLWGWQYGMNAKTCNIDTNLFNNEITDYIW